MFPPLMFANGLMRHVVDGFWPRLPVTMVLSLVLTFIWWRIWKGRLPARWLGWRAFILGFVANFVGALTFPLLAALGEPRF